MKITYKLKEEVEDVMPDQDPTPINERVIEIHGNVSTVTLQNIYDNMEVGKKMLVENEANAKIQKDIMDNIEEHNPFVLKFTDRELHACHMYFEAKALHNTHSDKVKEINKYLEEEQEDIQDILKQIPELCQE